MAEAKEEKQRRIWTQNEEENFLEALRSAEAEGSRSRWKFIEVHEIYGPYFISQGIDKAEMMRHYRLLSKTNKNFEASNFPTSLARLIWTNEDENELLKAVSFAQKNCNSKYVFKYILEESKFGPYFLERNLTHNQLYSKYKSLKKGVTSHATNITKNRVARHMPPSNPKHANRRRRWTEEEINLFRAGMVKHGRKWSAIIDDESFSELYSKYGRDNEDLRLKARDDQLRRKSPIILPAGDDNNVPIKKTKYKKSINV